MFEIVVVDCMIYCMEEDNLRKPKQICWMAKNNNFGGNLIWQMTKNDNFGGNLILRMTKNVNFGGRLICWILADF